MTDGINYRYPTDEEADLIENWVRNIKYGPSKGKKIASIVSTIFLYGVCDLTCYLYIMEGDTILLCIFVASCGLALMATVGTIFNLVPQRLPKFWRLILDGNYQVADAAITAKSVLTIDGKDNVKLKSHNFRIGEPIIYVTTDYRNFVIISKEKGT